MYLCAVIVSGHQSGFCMICVMQNHIIQAFANTGNAIKPVSFIRDLKSKTPLSKLSMSLSEQLRQAEWKVWHVLETIRNSSTLPELYIDVL